MTLTASSLALRLMRFVSIAILATVAHAGDLPKINNAMVHSPALISSGQPSKGQFGDLAGSGVQVVINLAPRNLPQSLGNEEELVRSKAMDYYFIPVDWDKPTQSDFDRFLQAMDASAGKTVLAHCWVNARSSAFVYLYRVIREKRPKDAEYSTLEKIWANNKGYELSNAPQWRTFLDDTIARYK